MRTLTGNSSINGNHGYAFVIPNKYRDGRTHALWAYGVSATGKVWSLGKSGITTFNLVTIPKVPGLSANPGDGKVYLQWNMSATDGATSYNLYKSGGNKTSVIKVNYSPSFLYYIDSDVVNGITYTYQLTAVNAAGESAKSNTVTVTPGSLGQVAYQQALDAIARYQAHPNDPYLTLTNVVGQVSAVFPYNNVQVSATNTTGLYDDALNRLIQAVGTVLTNTNKISTPSQLQSTSFSYASNVVLQGDKLFVSMPNPNAGGGQGIIYEYQRQQANPHQWQQISQIQPSNAVNWDFFGSQFAVNVSVNTLVALSVDPTKQQGGIMVNMFRNQGDGTWKQTYKFDLNQVTGKTPSIYSAELALSTNAVVIGMKDINKYLIYSLIGADQSGGLIWALENNTDINNLAGVAASGNYVVIGSSASNSSSSSVTVLKEGFPSRIWTTDKVITSTQPYFGYAVAVSEMHQHDQITNFDGLLVAIGSPLENSGRGAVYEIRKDLTVGTSASNTWTSLNAFPLVAHTPGYKNTLPGWPTISSSGGSSYQLPEYIGSVMSLNGYVLLLNDNPYLNNYGSLSPIGSVMEYTFSPRVPGGWYWRGALNNPFSSVVSASTDGTGVAVGYSALNFDPNNKTSEVEIQDSVL